MKQEFVTNSKEETMRVGRDLAERLSSGTVVALSGDLGAGKTTLTQGLLSAFDLDGPYTSPTFVIMKLYEVSSEKYPNIERIYHVDAYRTDAEGLLAIGWEEWLEDPAGIVVLEWPERVAGIVPENAVVVSLVWLDEFRRSIIVT